MGTRYLLDLADVCRSTGCPVFEHPGWELRGRSTGGYDAPAPTTVMWHHTASPESWDGTRDGNYLAVGHIYAPVSNLYVDRTGMIWVLAGGATNTNGKGSDTWGGGVPLNSMNRYAIGIECGNDGIGEPWPTEQRDAMVKLGAALAEAYGIPPTQHRAHFEYAPDRKIDPAGPPSPYARPTDRYLRWDMDLFRSDIAAALSAPPEPPTVEDDMRTVETGPFRWLDRVPLKAGTPKPFDITPDWIAIGANVTVVRPSGDGYVTSDPSPEPKTSIVQIRQVLGGGENFATLRADADGKVWLAASVDCEVIVDVQTYQPT